MSIFVGIHGRHTIDYLSTYPLGLVYGRRPARAPSLTTRGNLDVTIGNDVWMGRGAMIMAGITISDGAVVAARALVNRDVPDYAIVGGLPAKVIKYRFDDQSIAKLLALKWWDWPAELIAERLPLFNGKRCQRHFRQRVSFPASSHRPKSVSDTVFAENFANLHNDPARSFRT